jgi:hypothetical protein
MWLKSTKTLATFVRNRVDEIKKATDVTFRYVSTNENPADVASRGSSAVGFAENDSWWYGPSWAALPEDKWSVGNLPAVTPEVLKLVDEEMKKKQSTASPVVELRTTTAKTQE